MPRAHDNRDDDTPIRSPRSEARRRAESRRRMWLYSGIGGGLILAAVVAVVLVVNAGGRRLPKGPMDPTGVLPRADVEGVEWDERQVEAYLVRCGIPIKGEFRRGSLVYELKYKTGYDQPVQMNQWATARLAAEQSSVRPGSFAWGTFMFDGGPGELRARIADALGVRYP